MIIGGMQRTIVPGKTGEVYTTFPSFSEKYLLNDPIFPDLRTKVASFVEAASPQFEWTISFYNLYLLVPWYLALYVCLIVKQSRLIFALLAFNAHQIATALSAPTYYFMYYYSFYLGGLLVAAGFILIGIRRLLARRLTKDEQ